MKTYFKDKYLTKLYYVSCYTKNNKLICMNFTKDSNISYFIKFLKSEKASKIRVFDKKDKYIKYLKKETMKKV